MNSLYIAQLGRESDISIAELESVIGGGSIKEKSDYYALVNLPKLWRREISTFGGIIKFAEVVDELQSDYWPDIARYITTNALPEQVFETSDKSKKRLGISVSSIRVPNKSITGLGLELKKRYRKQGWSIGVVPNKSAELSSAQILHNKLHEPESGREINITRIGKKTYISLTTEVQDIEAYAERDHARPKRDAYVGMLPPKLAQIIINLAVADSENPTILDPFCGSGVILQESLLMGLPAIGADISERMVEYSQKNLEWLNEEHEGLPSYSLEVGDAKNHAWGGNFDTVATEMYLGEPLNSKPRNQELIELVNENRSLLTSFLKNIHSQLPRKSRLCLAVPAWKARSGFETSVTVDDLKSLGYTLTSFKHVDSDRLIYARPDQIVGRKLLVLTKS